MAVGCTLYLILKCTVLNVLFHDPHRSKGCRGKRTKTSHASVYRGSRAFMDGRMQAFYTKCPSAPGFIIIMIIIIIVVNVQECAPYGPHLSKSY